jgi:hypothetical protein
MVKGRQNIGSSNNLNLSEHLKKLFRSKKIGKNYTCKRETRLWQNFGKILAKSWQNLSKILAKSWQNQL